LSRQVLPLRPTLSRGATTSLVLTGLLAYLVVVPLGAVVLAALRTVPLDVVGPLTLLNVRAAVEGVVGTGTAATTAWFAGGSTLLSVVIGGYLAWVTERTKAPIRTLVHVAVVVNLIVPGILTAVSWSLLLHERIGILNALIVRVLGVAPFDAYSLPAMIWVDGSEGFALPYLLIAAALRSIDPSLEEAAATAGATRLRRLRTVTLPLLRPVVLTVALLTLVRALGTFVVPVTLGLPGGVRVLATEVYLQSRVFPRNANLAAAYALVQLLVALVALWGYQRATRTSERFVTIRGRGGAGPRTEGRGRVLHAVLGSGLVSAVVVLPFAVMVYSSLLPFYRPPGSGGGFTPTFEHYRWLAGSSAVRRAVADNLVVGGGAALVAVLLAAVIAHRTVRSPGPASRALDLLVSVPVALPGTVLGLALLWWYLVLPLPLYGTAWVLGIALVTTFLPYGARTLQASMLQVGRELEEASTMCGAGEFRTARRIVVPLLLPTIVAVVLFLVSRSFKQLALPSLLGVPGLGMVPTLIFGLSTEALYPQLSALGVVLSVGLAVVTLVARGAMRLREVRR
jgi:iron(III) transport system permease protein